MSSLLVRKALELFEDDFQTESTNVKKKNKGKDKMKQIGTSKKGVRKKLRKLKNNVQKEKDSKARAFKCAVDEYKRRLPQDHTNDNLYYLHLLSDTGKTDTKCTETILDQHKGRLAKNRPDKRKEEEATVFTDRDFDLFAKEYFS